MTLTVLRGDVGATGAASVNYSTIDGSAIAGSDYRAVSGKLEWAENDSTPRLISVTLYDTTALSESRTFSVTLASPGANTSIGNPGTARINITPDGVSTENDARPGAITGESVSATMSANLSTSALSAATSTGTFQIAAASYAVTQGTSSLVIPVKRLNSSSGSASVTIRTALQTASGGVDYTAAYQTLHWASGDSSDKSLTIQFLKTAAFTGNRTFQVILSDPSSGATIGSPGTATVTIKGSGSAAVGQVELSAASYSIRQDAGPLKVTVNRVGGSNGSISVSYAETGKTAVAGTDFTAASGTLRWASGDAAAKTITIDVSNAKPFSGTRSFTISLSSPAGGTSLGSPSTATATITGSAAAAVGTFQFSAATYSVAQNVGNAILTVNRTGGSAGAASVAYVTASGGAISGTDFTATRGTLQWSDGDAGSKTLAIPIRNATPFSGTRSFTMVLSSPTGGATLGSPVNATITITGSIGNTSPSGTLQLSSSGYAASQTDGTVNVKVNRTGGSSGVTTVKYATNNGTAVAGKDYTAANGTLQWNDGDTATKQVPIQVSSAVLFSGSKAFTVGISGATGGASLGSPSSATATIEGGASPAVGNIEFSASTFQVAQSSGGLTVTVNRTGGSTGAVSVNYATSNGSAVAGTDYTANSGTLRWADGDGATKSFSIAVSNGAPFTGTKSLTVTLSGASGGAGVTSPSTATVTITGSGTSGSPGSVFWVYHNGTFNWQGDYSWNASINYKDTAGAPISGSFDIAVSITAQWGGFQPYATNNAFDVRPWKYLIFSLKPTVPNQIIGMAVDAQNDVPDGNVINVVGVAGAPSTKYGPLPVVGKWGSYKIPIADFNLSNPVIFKFTIADGTGNSTNRYYVDDIGFTTQ